MKHLSTHLINAFLGFAWENGKRTFLACRAENITSAMVRQMANANGTITLNVSAGAVQNFRLDDDWLSFNATFQGRPAEVRLPRRDILMVFGPDENMPSLNVPDDQVENTDGMFSCVMPLNDDPARGREKSPRAPENKSTPAAKGSHLRVVK